MLTFTGPSLYLSCQSEGVTTGCKVVIGCLFYVPLVNSVVLCWVYIVGLYNQGTGKKGVKMMDDY